ncbi:MAG TPA: ferritin [Synergistaceae bacterium]|mgnify:CR=1 FL=1|nr:ferritin [Synergistaceae bacterium]
MMNKKIESAFNDQINAELFSDYLYLAMAAHLESENLKGMAHWMKVQADEEFEHAKRFVDFIHDRDGKVKYAAIEAPKGKWASPLEAFKEAYEHEQYISKRIHELMDLAIAEKDYPAQEFLHWFVSEQVEEEASTLEIVGKLEMVGDSKNGLFMMDHELGKREDD